MKRLGSRSSRSIRRVGGDISILNECAPGKQFSQLFVAITTS